MNYDFKPYSTISDNIGVFIKNLIKIKIIFFII